MLLKGTEGFRAAYFHPSIVKAPTFFLIIFALLMCAKEHDVPQIFNPEIF